MRLFDERKRWFILETPVSISIRGETLDSTRDGLLTVVVVADAVRKMGSMTAVQNTRENERAVIERERCNSCHMLQLAL